MMDHIRQVIVLLFLVNIILGRVVTMGEQRAWNDRLFQRRSAENDNEYVWFTRDIHNEMMKNPPVQMNRFQQAISHRKYPYLANPRFNLASKEQEKNV